MKIVRALGVGLACLLPSMGCSIQALTGDTMIGYTTEHMVPFAMSEPDVDQACETGVSMGQFLRSFQRVTDTPHRAAIITRLSAGICAEGAAWSAELRHLRAIHQKNVPEAQDARIEEQRHHRVAAIRYLGAWNASVAAFGEDKCPEFEEDNDKSLFLLGLMAGAQAVTHDRATGGEAGVPLDIPPKVARRAECLNDDAWWGVPSALKAAVWTSVPGAAPEGADPWAALQKAVEKGEAKNVRLARAVQILAAVGAGKPDVVRKAIVDHAKAVKTAPDPKWQLLDANATLVVQHTSDRLWTAAKGHRTPVGGLGTFWDEAGETETDDGLFDDLEDEDAAEQ
ncbi:MAG: hypothetical protein ACE366_10115 [Bradymonadia bacterium]